MAGPAGLGHGQEGISTAAPPAILLAGGQKHSERAAEGAEDVEPVHVDTTEGVPNEDVVPEEPADGKAPVDELETPTEGGFAPEQSKMWANLFRDNRTAKETIKLDQYKRTGKAVPIELEDVEELETIIGSCLVGCFMGWHPGRQGVQVIS